MAERRPRDWRTVTIAAVAGAAIALPLGIVIGNRRAERPDDVPRFAGTSTGAPSRDFYSPRFRSDPYVIAEQRRVAEALDLSCRQFKTHCREAEQARQRISEAEAGR